MFVRDLPRLNGTQKDYARRNGFRAGGEELRVQVAASMLMEDWAERGGVYETSHASVFVLSFKPRQFAFVPATRWRNEVGVTPGAGQKRFVRHFLKAVKQSPKDPVRGITNLAKSMDNHVFDQIDPERIAARKAAT